VTGILLGRLQDTTELRLPHPRLFRAAQIVIKVKLMQWRLLRKPRPPLLQDQVALSAIFRTGSHTPSERSAYGLDLFVLAVVRHNGEARCSEFVDIPEITRSAILSQTNDKEIVPAALYSGALIALGEQPNVGPPIRRRIAEQ
jgi:hypothetical protein